MCSEMEYYTRQIHIRNSRESVFKPLISSYLRIASRPIEDTAFTHAIDTMNQVDYVSSLDDSSIGAASASETSVQRNLKARIVRLQSELAELHLTRNDIDSKNKDLTNNLDVSNKRVDVLKRQRRDLELLLEEKMRALETLQRSLELQADEYRSLQIKFQELNDEYLKSVKENQVLIQQLTLRRSDAAEKLNAEIDQFNRRQSQHASNRPAYAIRRGRTLTTTAAGTIKSSVTSIFDQLFSPLSNKSPDLDASRTDNAQSQMPRVVSELPVAVQFRWKCADADNYDVTFNSNGSIVAIAGASRKIQLWTIEEQAPIKHGSLAGSNSAVTCICLDRCGENLLAGGSSDSAVRVWSLTTFRIQHTFTGHNAKVLCATFSKGANQILLSGSSDRTVKYWDLTSRQCCYTSCTGSTAISMEVNSDNILATGHLDRSVRLWDKRKQSAITTIQMPERVSTIHWRNDDQYICTCRDNCIYGYSRRNEDSPLWTIRDERLNVYSDTTKSCLSPDGQYLAIGCNAQYAPVFIWSIDMIDQSSGEMADDVYILDCDRQGHVDGQPLNPVICVAWSPRGEGLMCLFKQRYATFCK